MPIHIPINILDFIFKGILIGVIASAPMGPVGILCVQRTLNKGRWFGLATGVGAAASDIIYAGFAGFGMSFLCRLRWIRYVVRDGPDQQRPEPLLSADGR